MATGSDIPLVADISTRLKSLLQRASEVKAETTVEPPLPAAPFSDDVNFLDAFLSDPDPEARRNVFVEKAARDVFYPLIRDTDIESPSFVALWNLLDILGICDDQGQCAPDLECLLIEELLDSQTTQGCRKVFDYLESRRERLARKNFSKKNLVLLRSCNELLRRLSRAEDAKFCGRVFFFLFQTFPLGDKSSVNLRGEFHVENTTRFEVPEPQPEHNGDNMEVDTEPVKVGSETPKAATPQPPAKPGSKAIPIKAPPKKPEKKVEEPLPTNNELYPIFWRLQQGFSDPAKLFIPENFETFKKGLATTIAKFKHTPTVVQTKSPEDKDKDKDKDTPKGTKRKLGEDGGAVMQVDGDKNDQSVNGDNKDHFVDNYNPKYLTSRDLFDLELSDQAFQRHILVQGLILIDFLLSLTERSKKMLPLESATNKSLLYAFTLSEEDTKWATSTRTTITNYLTSDHEGRLFNRMVDTVLARDKNWVRWKIESCPSIVRDPVTTESEMAARKGAREWTRIRRVPTKPNGTMDLSFLDEGSGGGLAALQDPARYTTASIDELIDGIKTDELDLDFAMDDEEKIMLQNAMTNKRWRILRQARATRLELLDKVDPSKGLEAVFRPSRAPASEEVEVVVVIENEEPEPLREESGTEEPAREASGPEEPREEGSAEEAIQKSESPNCVATHDNTEDVENGDVVAEDKVVAEEDNGVVVLDGAAVADDQPEIIEDNAVVS